MSYKITKYTQNKAKSLGLVVKPSSVEGKKIDVYKKGIKLASVGAIGYNDYPTYMELEKKGKVPKGTTKMKYTNYRRRAEKVMKETNNKFSPASLSYNLIW